MAASNPTYAGVDGVLFDKNITMIVQFPEGKTGNYTMPNTVVALADSTFAGCFELTGLVIGWRPTGSPVRWLATVGMICPDGIRRG